ncbi:adenosylcobinamide kinase/adenosylcobinamide phosphate guanyltransferase [Desulfosarcina widdelii]|uniref:Adenosylcobinamide kinase n=1 Tax=Desulfosarcina widdelii TaxID=947919 RepID=A0A5K7ZE04_9BACT|nr:bifunctional adenosylcobinamide kinase/adenosylcobinamide-phosphate guanylyltransferase [Desulfosarcina widdelii]BBO74477.1 adenosylcobinamide kinase/adenosylcobinamide phosphate guanyltransferase [Desulfosarcina widdelii]
MIKSKISNNSKILILGGCRSGKSSQALQLAENMGPRRIFVATCVPHDKEMQRRVDLHRHERGDSWTTREVPLDLAGTIRKTGSSADVMLVDCLTLWLSNLLMENDDEARIKESIRDLAQAVGSAACGVILVSNEVGAGIVPENRLARHYRDLAGWTNQAMAAVCDRVVWTVAGIPVTIKPSPQECAP